MCYGLCFVFMWFSQTQSHLTLMLRTEKSTTLYTQETTQAICLSVFCVHITTFVARTTTVAAAAAPYVCKGLYSIYCVHVYHEFLMRNVILFFPLGICVCSKTAGSLFYVFRKWQRKRTTTKYQFDITECSPDSTRFNRVHTLSTAEIQLLFWS